MKTKYNKSEIMKEAWRVYKSISCLSFKECLKNAWFEVKLNNGEIVDPLLNENVKSIFEYLITGVSYGSKFQPSYWEDEAESILRLVAEKSKGFQGDIAKKAMISKRLSEKQAWCIAYEFKNVA